MRRSAASDNRPAGTYRAVKQLLQLWEGAAMPAVTMAEMPSSSRMPARPPHTPHSFPTHALLHMYVRTFVDLMPGHADSCSGCLRGCHAPHTHSPHTHSSIRTYLCGPNAWARRQLLRCRAQDVCEAAARCAECGCVRLVDATHASQRGCEARQVIMLHALLWEENKQRGGAKQPPEMRHIPTWM